MRKPPSSPGAPARVPRSVGRRPGRFPRGAGPWLCGAPAAVLVLAVALWRASAPWPAGASGARAEHACRTLVGCQAGLAGGSAAASGVARPCCSGWWDTSARPRGLPACPASPARDSSTARLVCRGLGSPAGTAHGLPTWAPAELQLPAPSSAPKPSSRGPRLHLRRS